MTDLSVTRKKIEEIDRQMAALFEARMRCAKSVAEYKSQTGKPILDAAREKALIAKNEKYIEDEELVPFYRQYLQSVMDISKQYQRRLVEDMKIAYSGVEGAFANIAAGRLFPDGDLIACRNFKEAYNAAARGDCEAAVLPIENSNAGEVGQVMDLMYEGELYVSGIYPLRITQNLLGVKGATLDGIRTVISHPHALEQCADYIAAHDLIQIQAANTALAAKQVAEKNDPTVAAIASRETAALYGLDLLDHDIHEDKQNTTRFAVLTTNRVPASVAAKSAVFLLMFAVKDEPGMLAEAIGVIGKHGFGMNALRSRPLKSLPWQYYFYAEIEGNRPPEELEEMLKELSAFCEHLKLLGATEEHGEL